MSAEKQQLLSGHQLPYGSSSTGPALLEKRDMDEQDTNKTF
jgi:hypothetical protein